VAEIYKLYGASTNLGLLITEGPHKDTQDLQLPVFRWFNRHLKCEDPLIEMAATKLFSGQELKVFDELPNDELVTKVHETFVPAYQMEAKSSGPDSHLRRKELQRVLREKIFRGWPTEETPFKEETGDLETGWKLTSFDSEEGVRLKLYHPSDPGLSKVVSFHVTTTEPGLAELKSVAGRSVLVVRGGPIDSKDRDAVHTRRRYMLVGQTLDSMRVWDIIRGVELFRRTQQFRGPIVISGDGKQAENVLLASLFLPEQGDQIRVVSDKWSDPPEWPDHLNLLRFTSWDELKRLGTGSSAVDGAEVRAQARE
jgi:hypothetical protein